MAAPYISSTQVASSVPFDNVVAPSFASTDVQAALKEIRDNPVFNSATQATTAAGTLTLTIASLGTQFFTGTAAGYNINLPDATLFPGNSPPNAAYYQFFNTTAKTIQVKDGSGVNLFVLSQNSVGFLWLQSSSTVAGTWIYFQTTVSTATGIASYDLVSSTAFANSGSADVVITGFTITPQAGTYAIWFNASATGSGSGQTLDCTIYKGGASITDSVRSNVSPAGSHIFQPSSMTTSQFNGSQACDVRINAHGSGMTINQRSLLLIRLGS